MSPLCGSIQDSAPQLIAVVLPLPKEPFVPGYCVFFFFSAQATRAAVEGSRAEGGAVMRDLPGRRREWDEGMRGEVS